MFLVSCSAFLWRYESLEVDTPRLIHNNTESGMLASRDSKRDKNPEHNTKNMRYKPFVLSS